MIYGVDAGSKFLKIVRQGALCPDECAGQDEGTRFIEHNGNPRHALAGALAEPIVDGNGGPPSR
ncbi:MAG: hypothetical protein KBA15_15645, partial [Spirochaetes bacterium]|nr:hypothetical protein [Spirochaetota bacterium]